MVLETNDAFVGLANANRFEILYKNVSMTHEKYSFNKKFVL